MKSNMIKREQEQYKIANPLLLLFSAPFIVWQMGVLYFSGNTMSLFGRTPIPLTDSDTTMVIAAGYFISILMICLFPRKMVWIERVLMPLALAATVLMLFPFSPKIITWLFYMAAFVCVFSIGGMVSIAAQHFTVGTIWRDGIISMLAGGILIAVLQNEFIQISFTIFTILSVLLIAAQMVFYYLIPAKIEVSYVSRQNKVRMPKVIFFGVWLISAFATLLICFANSYSESVKGGVSIIYLSAAAMALVLAMLRRRLGTRFIRVFSVFFALSVFGFVLAFLSLEVPGLQVASCVLLGFIVVLSNLWIFFAAVSFQVYPTRFIGAIGAAMGLVLAAFHSGLQEALRDNLFLLYGVYAALSVGLLMIYFFMEPYVMRRLDKEEEQQEERLHAFDVLSQQERTLAELIVDGYTETSAASAMNISLNTLKGYRKNLYLKLNIHSKRELFDLAAKRK